MNIYDELVRRNLIAQCTNEEEVKKLLNEPGKVFYIGFDPTADSLHVGHFLQIIVMRHLQNAGHIPIALFGGGTGMVGDPSGKTDMRKMLTKETVEHNINCFKTQMSRLLDFSDNKAIIANNADWLSNLNYIDFLREIGVHFSINRMLAAECYKSRLETGLTFFEINYMIMQSYDFYELNRRYNCVLELGGDDQWSNIIGGVELVRRKAQKEVYGLTFSLLTTSDGRKMGKTESGAVWLDENKTSVFDFYQYWRNIDDSDVIRMLKMITFMSLDKIKEYESLEGAELNKVKEILAHEVTSLVHGKEKADEAMKTAQNLFSSVKTSENMPTHELNEADFTDGKIDIASLLTISKLCSSKSEARRLIDQGGVSVNEQKVPAYDTCYTKDDFSSDFIVKKGKKIFMRFTLA